MRSMSLAWLLVLCTSAARTAAQEESKPVSDDIQRMVREGMVEALETKLRGVTIEDQGLLAQAYANKARRVQANDERKRAFEKADEKYRRWIEALHEAAKRGGAKGAVRLAAGRVSYADMLLSGPIASDLDNFELSLGQRGDRALLVKLFETARTQYEKAGKELAPLMEDLTAQEEDLLAAGLYDVLQNANLNQKLNLGWTDYYLGVLEDKDEQKKREFFVAAERRLQELVNLNPAGALRYTCYLALAMAQREQEKFKDASGSFKYALADDAEPATAARVRYELARCRLKMGKFDDARATLRPLVEKDAHNLGAADRPARFYINLAHVWDAYSYLLEADAIRREAKDSASRAATLKQAQRTRETGLGKLKHLADQGGSWPALVQIYVSASINLKAPLDKLEPIELLFSAGALMEQKRYADALERLREAAKREGVAPELLGDVLYDLGCCQVQLKQQSDAAETFARLAAEQRGHPKAPEAATLAYQLWGKIAESSKKPEDYLRLADTLRNLVESFADHPERERALWLLPVALQLAGRYGEAAERFGKVPPNSKNWEEAQYRRAFCAWKAVEIARAGLDPEEYRKRVEKAAANLVQYADEARQRAPTAPKPETVLKWSAEARVAAGELLLSPGLEAYADALKAIAEFEAQYPESELLGRVLALRIRAYRGLREFEQASQMLQRFLQTASAAQIGGTLAALAKGMQDEVERLDADNQTDAARKLAADSVATFEELEKWVRADPVRAANLEFVQSGRAKMHYLAGQYDEAQRIAAALLEKNPKNGNYQYLHALILTARLRDNAPAAEVKPVQDAWAALLTDPGIRQRAPERFSEARYHWLMMSLRLGSAADVEKAITQERVWSPDLGGPPWKEKLEDLWHRARVAQGLPPETQPGT